MCICCVPSRQQYAYELQRKIWVYKMSSNLNVLTQFYCALELRRAVKKFSEMWCRDRLSVSTRSRSRTLYSRGVPRYKPDKFGSVRPELGPDVVRGE
jgi:hypothetical protein